jgi:DNA invertase Pin-like site-specific DNA recombinase
MADGKTRAAIYARVSTEDQAAEGTTSIEDQLWLNRGYADRKGWAVVASFKDEGVSGTTDSRPDWQRLEAAARAGEFEKVVIARYDRLARDQYVGEGMRRRLKSYGVEIAVIEGDTDSDFVRGIRMLVAQDHRDTLVRNMARGQYGKARNGGWPSSASGVPFGMRKVGTGRAAHLEEDPHEAEVIRTAARLLVDERMTKQETATALNELGLRPRKAPLWSADLLHQVMSERARCGEVIWGKAHRIKARTGGLPYGEPVLIAAPAVLSPERFDLVQQALSRAANPSPLAKARCYPLSGRLFSPCGKVYQGRTRNDRVNGSWYRCANLKWRGDPGWEPCECPPLPSPVIETRVWAEVVSLLGDEGRLRALAAEWLGLAGEQADAHGGELARLDREIATLRERVSVDLDGFIEAGLPPAEVAASMARLTDKLAALGRRRDDVARFLADAEARSASLDQLGRLAATARDRLEHADLAFQAETLALLDVRVTVLDRTRTPALRVEGVICSEGIQGPAAASGKPQGYDPRHGWGPATAR